MKKLSTKVLTVLFCILLPIFLMLFSYKMALEFTALDTNQESTVKYLQDRGDLSLGESSLNYTANEVSHLEDVKGVMKIIDYLFYFSLLVLTLILTFYRKKKEETKKLLFYGGITTVIMLGMILLFLLLSFHSAFTVFHNLFFPQGNWQFASDSLLIQTFPLGFFIGMSYKIFVQSLIYGIIFILLYFLLKHAHSSQRD